MISQKINNETDIMFNKSIIVVAHPDDEILWLSSVLAKVDHIVFCFLDYTPAPELGSGRRRAITEYPLSNLSCLEITESGSYNGADWNNPIETQYGLEIASNAALAKRYNNNFKTLYDRLSSILAAYDNVYTHNPWGEYGHEDHVQVYRVVKSLQEKLDFNLWFSNYGGNHSYNLMMKYIPDLGPLYTTCQTNLDLATSIGSLYKKHKCWTWYGDYQWFREESFINDKLTSPTNRTHGHIFPINFIKTDFPARKNPGTIKKSLFYRLKNKFN
jgi:hypothetical protein